MSRDYVVTSAVIIGFAVVAIAVYFVLGRRATASVATSAAANATMQVRIDESARAALVAQKETVFVPRCWAPNVPGSESARGRYTVRSTFGADGRETSRWIDEVGDAGAGRGKVVECLRRLPADLTVPPPGMTVEVAIPLELP